MTDSYLSSPQYWCKQYERKLKLVRGITPKQIKNKVDYFRHLLKRQKPTQMAGFAMVYIREHT
jgi:hypothetical protein